MDELELGRSMEKRAQERSRSKKAKGLSGKIERARYETLRGLIESPFREVFCKQKRCFFSPLFNAPYEHFTSWDPRKYQS